MKYLFLACCVLLVSCSASPVAELKSLEDTQVCCRSHAEIPIAGSLDSEVRVQISASSPVFHFDSGLSRFFAFSIPASLENRQIKVRSLQTGTVFHIEGKFGGGQTYMFPAILFLDSSKSPISVSQENKLVAENFESRSKIALVAVMQIPPAARFGVLHTPQSIIGKPFEFTAHMS